jgi:hypothetical protein
MQPGGLEMNWKDIMKFVGSTLPAVGDFLGYIAGLSDEGWEEITKAWPAPIKLSMAKLRAETKALKHFFPED